MRTALLSERITNSINQLCATLFAAFGKKVNPKPAKVEDFLPDYLGLKKKAEPVQKSLEQQRAEWDAFKAHYRAMEAKAKGIDQRQS